MHMCRGSADKSPLKPKTVTTAPKTTGTEFLTGSPVCQHTALQQKGYHSRTLAPVTLAHQEALQSSGSWRTPFLKSWTALTVSAQNVDWNKSPVLVLPSPTKVRPVTDDSSRLSPAAQITYFCFPINKHPFWWRLLINKHPPRFETISFCSWQSRLHSFPNGWDSQSAGCSRVYKSVKIFRSSEIL